MSLIPIYQKITDTSESILKEYKYINLSDINKNTNDKNYYYNELAETNGIFLANILSDNGANYRNNSCEFLLNFSNSKALSGISLITQGMQETISIYYKENENDEFKLLIKLNISSYRPNCEIRWNNKKKYKYYKFVFSNSYEWVAYYSFHLYEYSYKYIVKYDIRNKTYVKSFENDSEINKNINDINLLDFINTYEVIDISKFNNVKDYPFNIMKFRKQFLEGDN